MYGRKLEAVACANLYVAELSTAAETVSFRRNVEKDADTLYFLIGLLLLAEKTAGHPPAARAEDPRRKIGIPPRNPVSR